MLLYIIRHAPAGQRDDPRYPDDSLRPLTAKGLKQMRRAVKKLSRRGFGPTVVATSPLVRCRQTADAIAERAASRPEVVESDSLKPGSQIGPLVAWSNEQDAEELAWVGHAPDVDELAAALVGARGGAILMRKGAVAAIRFDDKIEIGQGELCWLVTPETLGR